MFSRLEQGQELGVTRGTKIEWSNVLVIIAALEIIPKCIRSKQLLYLLKRFWENAARRVGAEVFA